MQASLTFARLFAALLLAWAVPLAAQTPEQRMEADLVAEGSPVGGETLTVAFRFRPDDGWHGYWSNPGEVGLGMTLDWNLPEGWSAGEPQYPVPQRYELFGFTNHVYEGEYAVLVPIMVPVGADTGGSRPITVDASWLVCSDRQCINESRTLTLRFPQPSQALRAQFDRDRAAIPPTLDSEARFALTGNALRIAIPLPAAVDIGAAHVYLEQQHVIDYGAQQVFYRDGDMLVARIPRGGLQQEPQAVSGILAFGEGGQGVRFQANPGEVPSGGERVADGGADTPLHLLLGGALLGGLLLNLMPCVFPILSLKALTLARAGESEEQARREALAYTAGVVLACILLGAAMLALRAGGEQVGWAFQLQQPLVVAALLVVMVLVTANLAGLFELPNLPIRSSGGGSAFSTGLLAAVVATPCTGPFLVTALGAALVLPAAEALLLFALLGIGLALPFLLLGFVPALRKALPKPGPWMERFRRIMAIPMGLTALALLWLAFRLGGAHFAFAALALGMLAAVAAVAWQRSSLLVAGIAGVVALYFAGSLPFRVESPDSVTASILDPIPFSQEALARQRAQGTPVFVWFTADWCVTCKVNEQVAIERESTRDLFAERGIVAMRGDWTRGDPEITRFLEQQGVAGVPLYIYYPPSDRGGDGVRLPQILTPDTLADMAVDPL